MLNKEIFIKLNQILFVIFIFVLWTLIQNQLIANAQPDPQNFRTLLEELNQLQREEPSLILFFEFIKPISGIEGSTLSVPNIQGENVNVSETWIGLIGDDYICFDTRGGQAVVERCVPFSNIVSVDYLASP